MSCHETLLWPFSCKDGAYISLLLLRRVSELPAAPRDALFLDALRGLNDLETASPELLEALAAVAFVPAADGRLAKPCVLYDPRCGELTALLGPATQLSSGDFASPQVACRMQPALFTDPWAPVPG